MKLFAFFHRWLGVVLGPFFAMWFFSGIVMMYVPFPSVPDEERLTYMSTIDAGTVTITPATAVAQCGLGQITGLRLISLNARPAYVCAFPEPVLQVHYADDGTRASPLRQDAIRHLIERESDQPIDVITQVDYDQWTVHQKFDAQRPLYRIELADSERTHLYIAPRTGELVQRTTSSQRFWNYTGSVPHWIYPTVLRKHWALWDAVVWWLSLFGILCAVIGVYLGVVHWIRVRRRLQTAISPFRSWMKWHHILGLFAGVIVISWIVSGWLSMDHGRLFSTPNPSLGQVNAVRGGSFGEVSSKANIADLTKHPTAVEFRVHGFAGSPVVVGKNQKGTVSAPILEPVRIADAVADAFPEAIVEKWGVVPLDDRYTQLREGGLPPGTIRVEMSDPRQTWVHIDGRTGQILSVLDQSRRAYRWLYNGLHSLDIPGLVNKRPLWDVVMLILLMAGFAASSTGFVIGIKRVLRTR